MTYHLFDSNVEIIKCNILAKDLEKNEDQNQVITKYHNSNRNGIIETYNHLKSSYYWPDMRTKISKIINECETCLAGKYEQHP